MRQRRGYQLHVGTASILLVFLTLCLSSFAVLTLVNANADKRLSDKLAARTKAYYEAVSEAERFIGEQSASGESAGKDFYFDENQYLRVSVEHAGGTVQITEYRVFTDEREMIFDENPFKVTR
ncbi:MAG: hypothetical protein IK016_09480 [Lachnospiraceae bacterium]|nr:hypothetical protein [Lachnospiraceae bacterium]